MRRRIRASIVTGLGPLALLSPALLSAHVREAKAPEIKAPKAAWKVPRMPWGHPDLQGVWTSDDLQGVPVERPKEYGTRRFLTEQELVERDGRITRLIESAATGERPREGFRASQKGVDAAAVPATWVEFARRASALTSLVSDPPYEHIPPLTEEAQRLAASQPSYTNMRPRSCKDTTWYDRCVSLAAPGEADRPRNSSKMRSYMGEPRGHWEGETLVVERKNFIGGRLAITFAPYSEDLTLVERFRRTGPRTLEYSVTVNDPRTYTAPWTATFPLTSEPGYQIFEYACHEGNYAMRNRLSAARAEEAREAAGGK
jgi:hypothetical protein